MGRVRDFASETLGRVDASMLSGLYTAVSVSPGRVRRWLRFGGRRFVDPNVVERPVAAELDETARWVISQSQFRLTVFGAVAGAGGAASVPPEVLATAVAGLRLAQRLAIVYGFDPASDRGEMAVWRALASGFEVSLPGQGPVSMRVSEVPRALMASDPIPSAGGALASAVMRESASMIGRRLSRLFPLAILSSGISANDAHNRVAEIGERMHDTLRRLADAPAADPLLLVDAVEVG